MDEEERETLSIVKGTEDINGHSQMGNEQVKRCSTFDLQNANQIYRIHIHQIGRS